MNSTWREAFLEAIEYKGFLEIGIFQAAIDFIDEFRFHDFCVS